MNKTTKIPAEVVIQDEDSTPDMTITPNRVLAFQDEYDNGKLTVEREYKIQDEESTTLYMRQPEPSSCCTIS